MTSNRLYNYSDTCNKLMFINKQDTQQVCLNCYESLNASMEGLLLKTGHKLGSVKLPLNLTWLNLTHVYPLLTEHTTILYAIYSYIDCSCKETFKDSTGLEDLIEKYSYIRNILISLR